jgi:hypothetical protein
MADQEKELYTEDKTFKVKGGNGLDVSGIYRKDGTVTIHYHNVSEPTKDDEAWKKEEDVKFDGTYQIIDKKPFETMVNIQISKKSYLHKYTDFLCPENSETKDDPDQPLNISLDVTHTDGEEFAHLSQNLLFYL